MPLTRTMTCVEFSRNRRRNRVICGVLTEGDGEMDEEMTSKLIELAES